MYKHFGKEVVAAELGLPAEDATVRAQRVRAEACATHAPRLLQVQTVWLRVYKSFMEAIDGIDNGVNQYVSSEPPRYQSSTDLSARVGKLNPAWNEEPTAEYSNAQFAKASALAGAEFLDAVRYFGKTWLPGRAPVAAALAARLEVHPSGLIVRLAQYCPWKEHLYELEAEQGIHPLPLFVLYADEKANWRVQAISKSSGSFDNRKSLPAAWAGLRDEALSEASGIPGGIFVHAGRFIGGNATEAGATAMAIKALELE